MIPDIFDKKPETEILAKKDHNVLQLVTALNTDNLDIYAFIIVKKDWIAKFEKALNNHELDLKKWGKIVASGYGKSPQKATEFEIIEAFNDGDFD